MLSFESDSLHDYNSMRLMSGICLCLCLLDPEDPLLTTRKHKSRYAFQNKFLLQLEQIPMKEFQVILYES